MMCRDYSHLFYGINKQINIFEESWCMIIMIIPKLPIYY